MNTVYIGYDPKEETAYQVLKFSLERISSKNIRVVPIRKNIMELMGLYRRESEMIDGQPYRFKIGEAYEINNQLHHY